MLEFNFQTLVLFFYKINENNIFQVDELRLATRLLRIHLINLNLTKHLC